MGHTPDSWTEFNESAPQGIESGRVNTNFKAGSDSGLCVVGGSNYMNKTPTPDAPLSKPGANYTDNTIWNIQSQSGHIGGNVV